MGERIYFDNAATTFPKPEAVWRAIDEANRNYAVNAGRGSYTLAEQAEQMIDRTRNQIRELARADEGAEVVLTPSATLACNQILGGLDWKESDVVYLSPYEHNAIVRVLYLLQERFGFRILELAVDERSLELDLDKIRYQFLQDPPDVLCMTHVSNVTGYILPVEEIASYVKDRDTTVIIDGSQALGLIPVELRGSGIDYYIFAGHKTLYGPFGAGGFIDQALKKLYPVIAGGTGTDSRNPRMPETGVKRYEPGSLNLPAIAGLHAAIEELGSDGRRQQKLCDREKVLIGELEKGLQKVPRVFLYLPGDEKKRSGICSFSIEGYQAEEVGMLLDEDYGIAVRCGYHCAPLIHKYLRDEGYGGTVRVSVGQFNTREEIEALIRAIRDIVKG